MGGGFMFTSGNSRSFATAPRLPNTAGATRGFHTHHPSTAVCGGCLQHSHSTCNCAFGPTPSRAEVERAIIELQRLMELSAQSEIDGLQRLLVHHNDLPKMIHSPGFIKFNDAFTMMRNEPSLQNMVISISCDKAVWESILSNKAVEDLQGSTPSSAPSVAEDETKLVLRYGGKEHDLVILIMKWVMGFTKSALFEKLASLVSEIFKSSTPKAKEKPTSELTDLLEEKLRSSVLLSVVILLIVVVTRNQS